MRKMQITIIALAIVLLLGCATFATLYFATDIFKSDKEMFYKYISQIRIGDIIATDEYSRYQERVKNENNTNKGNVSINVPEELKNVIEYRAHVQEIGWQDSVNNGQVIGTIGENLSIEAIELKVKDINSLGIEYRAHVQDIGWQDIVSDGATSGTVGQAKKWRQSKYD